MLPASRLRDQKTVAEHLLEASDGGWVLVNDKNALALYAAQFHGNAPGEILAVK